MTAEVFAPAKVNLTLHVTGRRSDDYHLLNSLVVFATDVGDRLTGVLSKNLTLDVTGPLAAGVPGNEHNIILKAAGLLRRLRAVTQGAHLTVDKKLPNAAGLGGGSADAAATIKLLAQLWDVPPLTPQEALVLGADVPVCLRAPAPTIVSGIGEELGPVGGLPVMNLVMITPNVSVPTARIFNELRRTSTPFGKQMTPLPSSNDLDTFCGWLNHQRNDLLEPAQKIAPEIVLALSEINAVSGCMASGMSGSGATVWGIFGTPGETEFAREKLTRSHPDWWCAASRIS